MTDQTEQTEIKTNDALAGQVDPLVMQIKLEKQITTPHPIVHDPLDVMTIAFASRNADFTVTTSSCHCDNYAVSFRVGPIGLNLRSDEADALGRALIDAAQHYRRVVS